DAVAGGGDVGGAAGAATEPVVARGPTGGAVGTEPPSGVVATSAGAARSARVAARCAFSNCASRLSSRRRDHPPWPRACSMRTNFFVDSSRKTPSLLDPPTAVPTSSKRGRSVSCGTGGGSICGGGSDGPATGGAGGRRDGENIGRSPVLNKALSGTAHN